MDINGIIIDSGKAGNILSTRTGLDTFLEFLHGFLTADFRCQEIRDGCAGALIVDAFVAQVISHGFHDCREEIFRGGIFRKLITPVSSACGDRIIFRVVLCCLTVINDLLCEVGTGNVECLPETVVFVFCEIIVLFVTGIFRSQQQFQL